MRPAARQARFFVTAAAVMSAAVLAIARVPPAHLRAASGPPPKVAIFGIDAADWRVIDPLIAAGHLPTFARLKQTGGVGVMRSEPPLLSPIIWTTIATGREPEDHGVLDFMVDTPGGGQAPVTGGARRVKAIWEIWSGANRNVLVTGWWATWPADHVRGVLVSDRLATPHLRDRARPEIGLVFPASTVERDQADGDVAGGSRPCGARQAPSGDSSRIRRCARGRAAVDVGALSEPDRAFPRGPRGDPVVSAHQLGADPQRPAGSVGNLLRAGRHDVAPVHPGQGAERARRSGPRTRRWTRRWPTRRAFSIPRRSCSSSRTTGFNQPTRESARIRPISPRVQRPGIALTASPRCRPPVPSRAPRSRRGSLHLALSRRSTSSRRCWRMPGCPLPVTCRGASSRSPAARRRFRRGSRPTARMISRATAWPAGRSGRRRSSSGCARSATSRARRRPRWPA